MQPVACAGGQPSTRWSSRLLRSLRSRLGCNSSGSSPQPGPPPARGTPRRRRVAHRIATARARKHPSAGLQSAVGVARARARCSRPGRPGSRRHARYEQRVADRPGATPRAPRGAVARQRRPQAPAPTANRPITGGPHRHRPAGGQVAKRRSVHPRAGSSRAQRSNTNPTTNALTTTTAKGTPDAQDHRPSQTNPTATAAA